jgi:hypothetical protein
MISKVVLFLYLCLGTVYITFTAEAVPSETIHDNLELRYRLLSESPEYGFERGTSSSAHLEGKMSLFGAMIMSADIAKNLRFVKHSRLRGSSNDTSVIGADTAGNAARTRMVHARALQAQLPFEVAEWPGVFTTRCPQKKHMNHHKTERGVAIAHYQIWNDFSYFDGAVLEAAKRRDMECELYQSLTEAIDRFPTWVHDSIKVAKKAGKKAWISLDSACVAFYDEMDNLSLVKNGVPFRDLDTIVILEDDADIATAHSVPDVLHEEISHHMLKNNGDLLYLGWCDGRLAWPVPLCLHAYALSRRGARKAVDNFQMCGLAVDEQLVRMCKNGMLKWARARDISYRPTNKNYPQPKDHTHGIFHQKRMGSFNGHTGYRLDNFESYTRNYEPIAKEYGGANDVSIVLNGASAK